MLAIHGKKKNAKKCVKEASHVSMHLPAHDRLPKI